MLANSEKTAITRRGPSAPCRWLDKQGRLQGPVLDWGCGKGADVRYIRNAYGYDPHFQPDPPPAEEVYNTVLCTYVLNTIPDFFARANVVLDALEYLAEGGWLYVTIRRRIKEGYTARKTWQGYAEVRAQLERGEFSLIHTAQNYEIWGWQAPR
ncbi:MAG: methyltransferase domain-containing protein [Planctomycetota bacterium]